MITVITVTRSRVEKLSRAMKSVHFQSLQPINHLILIDDCEDTRTFLENNIKYNFQSVYIRRNKNEKSGVARLAKLRNLALNYAKTEWVSFLDDDNEYTNNHLSTMLKCAKMNNCNVVHSWRSFYHSNGEPFLDRIYPWSNNVRDGINKWIELYEAGIFSKNSNIARDRVDSIDIKKPIRTVDANCLLIHKSIFKKIKFRETYTERDIYLMVGDDDKLLIDLVRNKIKIACTNNSTVKYYLGGFSNFNRAAFINSI